MACSNIAPKSEQQKREATSAWTAIIVPLIIIAIVGYATYVIVVFLGVNYLLQASSHYNSLKNRTSAGVAIIILYFVVLLPPAFTYFRLLQSVRNPGYVEQVKPKYPEMTENLVTSELHSVGATGENIVNLDHQAIFNGDAPAPPGTEAFYTKDVFSCDNNGLPNWCVKCADWKPDRAHHCSDVGKCVMKFDHFCPWVGGVVAEKNFKFFVQFNFYTAFYTLYILITSAYFVHDRRTHDIGVNGNLIAILALACLFFMFSAGMAVMSMGFAFRNSSTIEDIKTTTNKYLAIYIRDPVRFYSPMPYQRPLPDSIAPSPVPSSIPSTLIHAPTRQAQSNDQSGSWATTNSNPPSRLPSSSTASLQPPTFRILHLLPPPSPVPSSRAPSSLAPLPPTPELGPPAPTAGPAVFPQGLTSFPLAAPPKRVPPSTHSVDHTGLTRTECVGLMCNGTPSSTTTTPATAPAADEEPLWVASITYPLYNRVDAPSSERRGAGPQPRTFAILRLRPGKSPWDIGPVENWKEVMGWKWWEWFLPLKRSPCSRHDRDDVWYRTGREVERMKEEVGLV